MAKKAAVKKKTEKAAPPAKKAVSAKPAAKKKATKAAKPAAVEAATDAPAPSVEKQQIIEKFQVKAGDTGSPEVQAALLSSRIDKLVGHLKTNPGDNHSRRGLLGIVSKRRRLLNYLEKKDGVRYKDLVKKLGLTK